MRNVSGVNPTESPITDAAVARVLNRAPWLRPAMAVCRFSVGGDDYTTVTATGAVVLSRRCASNVHLAAEHVTAAVLALLREHPARVIDEYPAVAGNAAVASVALSAAIELGLGGRTPFIMPQALAQRVAAPDGSVEELATGLVIDRLRYNRVAPVAPIRVARDPEPDDDDDLFGEGDIESTAQGGDEGTGPGDTGPGDGDTGPGDTGPGDGDTGPGGGDTGPGDGGTGPGDGDTGPGDTGPGDTGSPSDYDVSPYAGRATPAVLDAVRAAVAHGVLNEPETPSPDLEAWAYRTTGRRSPHEMLRRYVGTSIDVAVSGTRSTWRRPALFVDESDDPAIVHPGRARAKALAGAVVDVSGSIGDDELADAVGVLSDIAADRGVDARYVCVSDRVLGPDRPLERGGDILIDRDKGATDMRAGLSHMARLGVRSCLVVTDGKTPWPVTPIRGLDVVVALVGPEAGAHRARVPGWMRAVVL